MSRYSSHDEYLDAASRVLKNRLGVTEQAALDAAEAEIVSARSLELVEQPIAGRFDLAHLKAIHRHLFGDVYEWAGQLRTVDIGKGASRFAHHAYIESAATPIFKRLAQENYLSGMDATAFSERVSYYLGELNALHPFRDGNGRALREWVSQLAQKNGYRIAWENTTQAQMVDASIRSFSGDTSVLSALIRQNLQPLSFDQDQG